MSIVPYHPVPALSKLDDQMIRTVLCIVTQLDRDTVEETYTFEKAVNVIIEFWELENMSSILGKARNLAGNQEFQERNAG